MIRFKGGLSVLGGGGVENKQVYFEYAKPQWESEQVGGSF